MKFALPGGGTVRLDAAVAGIQLGRAQAVLNAEPTP